MISKKREKCHKISNICTRQAITVMIVSLFTVYSGSKTREAYTCISLKNTHSIEIVVPLFPLLAVVKIVGAAL